MKMNYRRSIACLIAIIVTAAVASPFYVSNARGGDILHIDHVAVTKNLIQLDGGTSSSGEGYKDYEYNINDEDLYITIKYVIVSMAYRSGNFSIEIKDDFSQIKRIYLKCKETKKLIWQSSPATAAITQSATGTSAKTTIILPADRITSGELVDGRVGGVLQYQLATNELSAFIDYFNERKLMEEGKKEVSTDHDYLSDSTDVILHLNDGIIYIKGYQDGETVITDSDGSGYSIFNPELTNYLTTTLGGILRYKGSWK